jgi:hypothetical protein
MLQINNPNSNEHKSLQQLVSTNSSDIIMQFLEVTRNIQSDAVYIQSLIRFHQIEKDFLLSVSNARKG